MYVLHTYLETTFFSSPLPILRILYLMKIYRYVPPPSPEDPVVLFIYSFIYVTFLVKTIVDIFGIQNL